jgi:hypothetical protein
MNVKELKEILNKYPDETEVFKNDDGEITEIEGYMINEEQLEKNENGYRYYYDNNYLEPGEIIIKGLVI